MKKSLLFFLVIVAIFIHGKGILVDANPVKVEGDGFQSEKIIIESLFKQRAELWNDLYDEGEKNQWMKQLDKIVTQPLLDFDIETFNDAKEYPLDLDKVIDLKIVDIHHVNYKKDKMDAKIKICWKMQGMQSSYEEEISYDVLLKRENDQWKLSDYETE